MSIYNVPEQRLEPKEAPNSELITNINHACEKLTYNINRMKEEQAQMEEILSAVEYLSFDLKEAVREHYQHGIENREMDLLAMTDNLERLGAF